MVLTKPLSYYIRKRQYLQHARKPTAHEKITARPYINPQHASPVFSQLPGEIRQMIYEYALLGYPDLSRPYSKHSFHYRPGYTHARSISTNLLLTCRRVYLEAGQLAVAQNEHLIYHPADHGPPGHRPYLLPGAKMAKGGGSKQRRGLLRETQRKAVYQVHIFAQQCWLEGWNMDWAAYCASWSHLPNTASSDKDCASSQLCNHPPSLKITIRHTDWWYYVLGRNSPLALDARKAGRALPGVWVPEESGFEQGSWGSQFKKLTGIEVFELEMETLAEKREELNRVVENATKWRFALADDSILVCDVEATAENTWIGSKHVRGHSSTDASSRLGSGSNSRAGSRSNSTNRLLVTDSDELQLEESLNYYVVTLTWRAKAPGRQHKTRRNGSEPHGWAEIEPDNGAVSGESEDGPDPSPTPPLAPAAPLAGLGIAAVPQVGIFATNIARAPTRHVIPTYYG